MSWAIFCILLCLGWLTVMGQAPIRKRPSQRSPPFHPSRDPPYRPPPSLKRRLKSERVQPKTGQSQPVEPLSVRRVPYPGQQCVDSPRGFVGACSLNLHMCEYLICARPDGRGGFDAYEYLAALPYTICGINQICLGGRCVDADPTNMPMQTGEAAIVDCFKDADFGIDAA